MASVRVLVMFGVLSCPAFLGGLGILGCLGLLVTAFLVSFLVSWSFLGLFRAHTSRRPGGNDTAPACPSSRSAYGNGVLVRLRDAFLLCLRSSSSTFLSSLSPRPHFLFPRTLLFFPSLRTGFLCDKGSRSGACTPYPVRRTEDCFSCPCVSPARYRGKGSELLWTLGFFFCSLFVFSLPTDGPAVRMSHIHSLFLFPSFVVCRLSFIVSFLSLVFSVPLPLPSPSVFLNATARFGCIPRAKIPHRQATPSETGLNTDGGEGKAFRDWWLSRKYRFWSLDSVALKARTLRADHLFVRYLTIATVLPGCLLATSRADVALIFFFPVVNLFNSVKAP